MSELKLRPPPNIRGVANVGAAFDGEFHAARMAAGSELTGIPDPLGLPDGGMVGNLAWNGGMEEKRPAVRRGLVG